MPRRPRVMKGSLSLSGQSIDAFHSELRRVAARMETEMLKIAGRMKRDAQGFLATDAQNLARLAVARKEIANALGQAGYTDAVTRLLGTRSELAKTVSREYGKFAGRAIGFAQPDLEAFAAITGANFTAFAELGDEATNALRRSLQRAVTSGLSWDATVAEIQAGLGSGFADGKTGPGAWAAANTLATTATTQLHRLMSRKLDEELGVTAWRYVGPDDEVTRDFCRDVLEEDRAWTEDEINELDNSREAGGAGAGPGSAFEQGGGWNCRHIWEPVLPDEVPVDAEEVQPGELP